jgi:hypothetical protein
MKAEFWRTVFPERHISFAPREKGDNGKQKMDENNNLPHAI